MNPYASADDAPTDVLRLRKGISHKNAIGGIALRGEMGGKAVVIIDLNRTDKATLLCTFSSHNAALDHRAVVMFPTMWLAVVATPSAHQLLSSNTAECLAA